MQEYMLRKGICHNSKTIIPKKLFYNASKWLSLYYKYIIVDFKKLFNFFTYGIKHVKFDWMYTASRRT